MVRVEKLFSFHGGSGDDIVTGSSGQEHIYGGLGNAHARHRRRRFQCAVWRVWRQPDALIGQNGNDALDGGDGRDDLMSAAGSDTLKGGLGADTLDGGSGGDTFSYDGAADSTSVDFDTIIGFNGATDRINTGIPIEVPTTGRDDDIVGGSLDGASFDSDLGAAVSSSTLAADHFVIFKPDAGSHAGDTVLVIDRDGVAGYQSGADLVISLESSVHLAQMSTGTFV